MVLCYSRRIGECWAESRSINAVSTARLVRDSPTSACGLQSRKFNWRRDGRVPGVGGVSTAGGSLRQGPGRIAARSLLPAPASTTSDAMLPPVEQSVLENNRDFAALYSKLTISLLNSDGSSKSDPATKERRLVSEVRDLLSQSSPSAPGIRERAESATQWPSRTTAVNPRAALKLTDACFRS